MVIGIGFLLGCLLNMGTATATTPSGPASPTGGAPSASTPAGAPDPGGSFGIQLLDAPVSGRDDPRAHRYIVDHLRPGTTIERRIQVVNKSPKPMTIAVYPGAASIQDEQFQVAGADEGNELTGWISMATDRLELAPGEKRPVMVTLDVPADASRGERYGVIWASSESGTRTGTVSQVHRVGVRIYLDVGPGGAPITAFDIGPLTPARNAAGTPSVTIAVTNTGERALDLAGSVTLRDGPAGLGAGPFTVTEGSTLGPGSAGSVSVAFPAELPNGPWTVDVQLSSGIVKNTASATITFPDAGQVGTTSTSEFPWLWVGIGVVAAVLLVLAIFVLPAVRSRRRQADSERRSITAG